MRSGKGKPKIEESFNPILYSKPVFVENVEVVKEGLVCLCNGPVESEFRSWGVFRESLDPLDGKDKKETAKAV